MPRVQAFLDLSDAEMRRVEMLAAFAGRTHQELFDGCLARGLLAVEDEYHEICARTHPPDERPFDEDDLPF